MGASRHDGASGPSASGTPARDPIGSPPPARAYLALAALLVGAGLAYLAFAAFPERAPLVAGQAAPDSPQDSRVSPQPAAQPSLSTPRSAAGRFEPSPVRAHVQPDFELPSLDPDDVAAYIRPGDPEPTAAELIEALQEAGIREGLGAFNPPGTSPPIPGLAVPQDFVLPEGFVRHHQVTDEGEPLEPILMFSPDYEFVDAHGDRLTVPPDRVVPPELAPPGLPIRPIDIPAPKD